MENEGFLEIIQNILQESNKAMTISDIQNVNEELPTSNQRMSALMKKLVESGVVEKTYEKRKPYFKWVDKKGEETRPTYQGNKQISQSYSHTPLHSLFLW